MPSNRRKEWAYYAASEVTEQTQMMNVTYSTTWQQRCQKKLCQPARTMRSCDPIRINMLLQEAKLPLVAATCG